MPLSEHEQQILEEIERGLAADDPKLVQQVERADLRAHLVRRIRWSVVGFIAGCALLFLFVVSPWVAAAGFVLMVLSAVLAAGSIRRLRSGRTASISGMLGRLVGRGDTPESPPPG
jgi:hypothetical protein